MTSCACAPPPRRGSLHGLAPLLEPTNKDELSATRRQLRTTGYKSPSAFRLYHLARSGFGPVALMFGLFAFVLIPEELRLTPAIAMERRGQ